MRKSSFERRLEKSVGSVIKIKKSLFWHRSGKTDCEERCCVVLPYETKCLDAASTTHRVDNTEVFDIALLIDGKPIRTYVSVEDIDFLDLPKEVIDG